MLALRGTPIRHIIGKKGKRMQLPMRFGHYGNHTLNYILYSNCYFLDDNELVIFQA